VGRKLHVGGGLLSCEIGPDGALIFDIAKGAVARHLLRISHTIRERPGGGRIAVPRMDERRKAGCDERRRAVTEEER
jgi:hypothetical protein